MVVDQPDQPTGQPAIPAEPAMPGDPDDSDSLAELGDMLLRNWSNATVGYPWLGTPGMLREIGQQVVLRERQVEPIPGHNWVVVRMDANGFDEETRNLRHDAVLESLNSPRCSVCMTETLKRMMQTFSGAIGFAHHSELVFVVPPTEKDLHELHNDAAIVDDANMRAVKYFGMHLAQLEKQVTRSTWLEILWPFGCKISSYSSFEEARTVLVWRAQSCFASSTSDEVNRRVFVPSGIRNGQTAAQLEWLSRRHPLQGHAASGTLMVRRTSLRSGHHPETHEPVSRLCSTIETLPESLLRLASGNLLDTNLFDVC